MSVLDKPGVKLQTGLRRVQDMTIEERELHFRTEFFKADCTLCEVQEILEGSFREDVRITEAIETIERYYK